jgi:hypothetical protein
MTLAVAWERETIDGSELVFAADSRVRQGGVWDTCPKVFRLPRTDAMIAFAGETLWTYPIILQIIATMDAFEPSRNRRYPLRSARGHALRSIDAMMQEGDAVTEDYHEIDFEFLFGGWSWQDQKFLLWRLYWSRSERRMRHESVEFGALGLVRFIGTRDRKHKAREDKDPTMEVVGAAKERLSRKLRQRNGELGRPLDLEPWEVLVEMLRADKYPTLGGPPQMAKVYRYMDSRILAVQWPDANGSPTLGGRRLIGNERTDAQFVDPDNPFPKVQSAGDS